MAFLDPKDFKTLDNEIELLGKLYEELPEILQSDAFLDQEFRTEEERVGSALRVLYSFLKEIDPHEHWAGLEKVITPDGNILWLCPQHLPLYRTQLFQIDEPIPKMPPLPSKAIDNQ